MLLYYIVSLTPEFLFVNIILKQHIVHLIKNMVQYSKIGLRGGFKMKTGLVLEGGAIRTIYSCGVLDAFSDNDIDVDYMIGCSAGVAFGTSYLSHQPGRMLDIIREYGVTTEYMGIGNLINPKNRSYFNLKFAYETIPNELNVFDWKEFLKFKGDCKAVVTNLRTGNADYLDVSKKDPHFTVIKATCALPMMSPIIKYKGNLYLDGGIADSIPYKKALEDGCDKLIIILTRDITYQKGYDSLITYAKFHYRQFPEFCKAMETRHIRYNQTLEELKELEKEGKVFIFRPDSTKGFKRNERNVEKILDLYNQGYIHGKERLNELKEYLKK